MGATLRGLLAVAVMAAAACACAAPFGLGEPSSRALERGVIDSLNATAGFEVTGSYTEASTRWRIDLEVQRPATEHILLNGGPEALEAIVTGGQAYFRGQSFLAAHLGADPQSQSLARAAGSAWWKAPTVAPPPMPDLTDGATLRQTFLGSAVTNRTDHVRVGGVDTVELSGQRADVYIAEAAPYRLVRLAMAKGVVIDGFAEADFTFAGYDTDFHITAPTQVIDFSNLSTLPPVYTVLSVDTSGCASPCLVSAQLKNLGGLTEARGPSSVLFTMTDAASGTVIGRCSTFVSHDVGYNQTTTVGCTMTQVGGQQNAAVVTATADNPGLG